LRLQTSFSLLEFFDKVNSPAKSFDKEEIWQKAMMGIPISEEEFDRM
jgi:hypothetical protein